MCLLTGINANVVSNGVAAIVNVTLSSTVANSTSISVTNPIAASATGGAIPITGTGGTITVTGGLPVTLASLTCNPTSLTTPGASTCTVALNQPAPSSTTVALRDNNSSLTVPASVTIAAGSPSGKFSATAGAVSTTQTAVVTATLSGSSQTASLTLLAPLALASLQCSPSSLSSGGASMCTVTLNQPTSANTIIGLSDNSASLTVPASVTVSSASTSANFMATAGTIASAQTAVVTATLGSSSQTASLTLMPSLALASLQCGPRGLTSGSTSTCTVTLNQPAPANTAVALSDNNSLLTVPASVNVAAATTSATFNATAGTVSTTQTAVVTARLGGSSQTTSLILAPPLALSSLQCPTSLVFGAIGTCTVSMNRIALKQITISISDNSKALGIPSSVKVLAGSSSASFSVAAGSVAARVTVIATYNTVSQWATISIAAAVKTTSSTSSASSISSLVCSPATLIGSATSNCSVGLAQAAPATGTQIVLATDAGLQIPDTVWASPGSTSAHFSIRGWVSDSDQPANILATTPDGAATANLSVLGIKPVSLSCSPKAVHAGDPITCEVQLNSAQIPDVLTLDVSSSRAEVQVPASITTRPLQSTLSFQSYSSPGGKQQSETLQVAFGINTAQDSVITLPASGPVLTVPGKQMAKAGTPVSFAVSAVDASGGAVSLSASKLPSGASFDPASGNFNWIPRQSQLGSYDVGFTAVNSLQVSATQDVRIEVGSGKPAATALVNGASQAAKLACSPGGIASLLGSWLVQDNSGWSAAGGQATQLGGTQVRVNGDYVPLLNASGVRVDFLCPQVAPGATLQVVLETGAGQSGPISAAMQDATPGIFTIDGSGQGQGMILFPGTSAVAMVRNPLVSGEPAQPGDTLAILVTGLSRDAQVSVTLGDVPTPVQSIQAVAGNPGVYEVLVTVPAGVPIGDAVPVRVQLVRAGGGVIESNVVTMAVEPVRP